MWAGLAHPVQSSRFIDGKLNSVSGKRVPRSTSLVQDRSRPPPWGQHASWGILSFESTHRILPDKNLPASSTTLELQGPGESQQRLGAWHWAWGVVLSPSFASARYGDGLAGPELPALNQICEGAIPMTAHEGVVESPQR